MDRIKRFLEEEDDHEDLCPPMRWRSRPKVVIEKQEEDLPEVEPNIDVGPPKKKRRVLVVEVDLGKRNKNALF